MSWIIFALVFWLAAWALNEVLSRHEFGNGFTQKAVNLFIPPAFVWHNIAGAVGRAGARL
jgi:hypothetical protein